MAFPGRPHNTAKSFSAILSKTHLGRYLAEFSFRWKDRYTSDGQRFVAALDSAEDKRLMDRQPVGGNAGLVESRKA